MVEARYVVWPELRVDGTLSAECSDLIFGNMEFSGTSNEIDVSRRAAREWLSSKYSLVESDELHHEVFNAIQRQVASSNPQSRLDWRTFDDPFEYIGIAVLVNERGEAAWLSPASPFDCVSDMHSLFRFRWMEFMGPTKMGREKVAHYYWQCRRALLGDDSNLQHVCELVNDLWPHLLGEVPTDLLQ